MRLTTWTRFRRSRTGRGRGRSCDRSHARRRRGSRHSGDDPGRYRRNGLEVELVEESDEAEAGRRNRRAKAHRASAAAANRKAGDAQRSASGRGPVSASRLAAQSQSGRGRTTRHVADNSAAPARRAGTAWRRSSRPTEPRREPRGPATRAYAASRTLPIGHSPPSPTCSRKARRSSFRSPRSRWDKRARASLRTSRCRAATWSTCRRSNTWACRARSRATRSACA